MRLQLDPDLRDELLQVLASRNFKGELGRLFWHVRTSRHPVRFTLRERSLVQLLRYTPSGDLRTALVRELDLRREANELARDLLKDGNPLGILPRKP